MLEEYKKEIVLSNIGYKEYLDRKEALKKAREIREKYNISVYPKRYTKEALVTGKKNICRTVFKEVFVLC